MKALLMIICTCVFSYAFTQDTMKVQDRLPFYEIPDYPQDYSSGNVLVRMVQGLGFRYYWATDGLTEEDLDYRPAVGARSTGETIEHLYDLSMMILNAASNRPHDRSTLDSKRPIDVLRTETLNNFEETASLFNNLSAEELADKKIQFKSGDKISTYPIWHLINGPINDSVYHTGQIVSFRRTTNNPINQKISVFTGTVKE